MSESKGFRVTVEDLDTGEKSSRVVYAGDFMLIPFAPCYWDSSQAYPTTGTVQLVIKGYRPERKARDEVVEKYRVGARIRFPIAGHVYRIIAVDAEPPCSCESPFDDDSHGHHPDCTSRDPGQRRVTFADDGDPEDSTSETMTDLDAADVQVLP